jgi:hypothetical protein
MKYAKISFSCLPVWQSFSWRWNCIFFESGEIFDGGGIVPLSKAGGYLMAAELYPLSKAGEYLMAAELYFLLKAGG